jgi:hypothetical protein
MRAGRTGAEIEVAADAMFVMVVVRMNAAVGVAVALRVGRAGRHRRCVVVIVTMLVRVAVYRAVRMSMLFTLDLRLARATAAY